MNISSVGLYIGVLYEYILAYVILRGTTRPFCIGIKLWLAASPKPSCTPIGLYARNYRHTMNGQKQKNLEIRPIYAMHKPRENT